jgi:DNA-directed RNA polymerase subunit N (RpoN/RPB10)
MHPEILTIPLKCEKCGKVTEHRKIREFDDKLEYECTICKKHTIVDRRTVIAEWWEWYREKLMEMRRTAENVYIDSWKLHSYASTKLHDRELERETSRLLDEILRLMSIIKEKMRGA